MEIVLQKQRSSTCKGTTYYKYRVMIPAQIVDDFKLLGGERFDVCLENDKIVIRIVGDG